MKQVKIINNIITNNLNKLKNIHELKKIYDRNVLIISKDDYDKDLFFNIVMMQNLI